MTDKNILSVSEIARDKIIEIRDQEPGDEAYALLVEVTGIRGNQFAYELSFVPEGDRPATDHVDRHGDLIIAVPENDVENLRGASLDLTAQGLAMNNPNSPSPTIGSGPVGDLSGPLADQVAQVLASHVNPAIAGHVYLRLMGGCQGCGMAAVTLGQGIERILKDAIPEIAQVIDVTDHASGSNPYYEAAKK
jgi:Fe/S biogenesis protein NfuA